MEKTVTLNKVEFDKMEFDLIKYKEGLEEFKKGKVCVVRHDYYMMGYHSESFEFASMDDRIEKLYDAAMMECDEKLKKAYAKDLDDIKAEHKKAMNILELKNEELSVRLESPQIKSKHLDKKSKKKSKPWWEF